jgi:hypothetical protein
LNFRSSTELVAALSDHLKRLTIYNYPPSYQRLDKLRRCLDEVESCVEQRLEVNGMLRVEALQANIEKLLTGPDARYKGGQYSDLAAQLRADKTPDNDDV